MEKNLEHILRLGLVYSGLVNVKNIELTSYKKYDMARGDVYLMTEDTGINVAVSFEKNRITKTDLAEVEYRLKNGSISGIIESTTIIFDKSKLNHE